MGEEERDLLGLLLLLLGLRLVAVGVVAVLLAGLVGLLEQLLGLLVEDDQLAVLVVVEGILVLVGGPAGTRGERVVVLDHLDLGRRHLGGGR